MDGHNFQSHGMINKDKVNGLMFYYQQAELKKLSDKLYRTYLSDRGKCKRWGLDKINEIADREAENRLRSQ